MERCGTPAPLRCPQPSRARSEDALEHEAERWAALAPASAGVVALPAAAAGRAAAPTAGGGQALDPALRKRLQPHFATKETVDEAKRRAEPPWVPVPDNSTRPLD